MEVSEVFILRLTCSDEREWPRHYQVVFHHFTGSIACSATSQYSSYSEANFEVFRPAGATRCTDAGEIWHRCKISPSPIGATVRV